jgi:phosphatidylglycerol lysyltransferase
VIAFCVLTIWLGLLTVGGLVFLLEPFAVPSLLHLPLTSVRPLGAALLSIVAAYLLLSALRKAPFRIRDWEMALPGTGLSLAQIAVSSLDWALAGAVLFVLLPPETTLSYPAFLALFILAQLAAMLSQVPGGLGVFETVMLLLLAPHLGGSHALGSLIAYRLIYYLIPLGLAAVILGGYELLERRAGARRVARLVGAWAPRLVPNVLAFTTLLAGAILLFSGATPAAHTRLAWLEDFLPLPVVEVSHFLEASRASASCCSPRGSAAAWTRPITPA